MDSTVSRRSALTLGGGLIAAGTLPAAALPARTAGMPVLLFDATIPDARSLAAAVRGVRLVALSGDPVRLWRDDLAYDARPLRGITRWSDFLVLRSLAEEQGLRLKDERRIADPRGAMLVDWKMA